MSEQASCLQYDCPFPAFLAGLWVICPGLTARHSQVTAGVLELPAEARDAYVRHVSAAEGLLNLGAQVVRTAQPMLGRLATMTPGLSAGLPGSPIAVLSLLQRCMLWQLAVAEDARRGGDAAAGAGAKPGGEGEAGAPSGGPEGFAGGAEAGGAGAPAASELEAGAAEESDRDAVLLGAAEELAAAGAEDRRAAHKQGSASGQRLPCGKQAVLLTPLGAGTCWRSDD